MRMLAVLLVIGLGVALKVVKARCHPPAASPVPAVIPPTPTLIVSSASATAASRQQISLIRRFFGAIEPRAKATRTLLQMGIGIIIVVVLVVHVGKLIWDGNFTIAQLGNDDFSPLRIVGVGLLFSTAIELAYLLFTHGPDEAIDDTVGEIMLSDGCKSQRIIFWSKAYKVYVKSSKLSPDRWPKLCLFWRICHICFHLFV